MGLAIKLKPGLQIRAGCIKVLPSVILYRIQSMPEKFFIKVIDVYDGKHKPIIDQEVWNRAQNIFKTRDTQVTNLTTRISASPLLKGILTCGCCGSGMTPSNSMKKNSTC